MDDINNLSLTQLSPAQLSALSAKKILDIINITYERNNNIKYNKNLALAREYIIVLANLLNYSYDTFNTKIYYNRPYYYIDVYNNKDKFFECVDFFKKFFIDYCDKTFYIIIIPQQCDNNPYLYQFTNNNISKNYCTLLDEKEILNLCSSPNEFIIKEDNNNLFSINDVLSHKFIKYILPTTIYISSSNNKKEDVWNNNIFGKVKFIDMFLLQKYIEQKKIQNIIKKESDNNN